MKHTDPNIPEAAKPRLGGQNGLILDALREGPALNIHLEIISGSRRINSRIADCRRFLQQYDDSTIVAEAVDTVHGIYRYKIEPLAHKQEVMEF